LVLAMDGPEPEKPNDHWPRHVTFSYKAGYPIYACNWSNRHDTSFRLALGSFKKEYSNRLEIIQLNNDYPVLRQMASFEHPYPATKIMWSPDPLGKDLLASTSDFLRIYELNDKTGGQTKQTILDPRGMVKSNDSYSAPLTSFDWHTVETNRIATSSVDTTVAIWDIEAGRTITQLIAHDKEVYDIAFATKGTDVFASVGADGSCRTFDQRQLSRSDIVYETPDMSRLIRLAWNKKDANYIALVSDDSPTTVIIDIRVPSKAAFELARHHTKAINSIAWAPHSANHICTVADDCQALIWDTANIPSQLPEPTLSYQTKSPINQVQWSARQSSWISIAVGDVLQLLKV